MSQIHIKEESRVSTAIRHILPSLLFISLVVETGFRTSWIRSGGHAFQDGDWLINYSAGFIRRGLFGSLILSLHLSSQSTLYLLLIFQLLCYVILACALISFLERQSYSWPSLAIVLSPAAFMFIFLDQAGAFRKEIILYASLSLLYFVTTSKRNPQFYLIPSILLYVLGVFSWDGIAFLAPMVVVAFFALKDQNFISVKQKYFYSSIVILTSFLGLVVSVFFKGGATEAEVICSGLRLNHGFSRQICDLGGGNGAIVAIGWPTSKYINDTIHSFPAYFVYLLFLALAMLPFYLFFGKPFLNRSWKYFLLLTPLFILAIDYGRWISLFVICLILLSMIENQEIQSKINLHPIFYLIFIFCWGFQHFFNHFVFLNLIAKFWAISTGAWYPPHY